MTVQEPAALYEEDGAVAVLTLNRAPSLNSFTRQMHRDLWAALDKVEANPAIRAVVLTVAGRAFCAGAVAARGFASVLMSVGPPWPPSG